MKILVCTDGSKESQKAMEETVKFAGGCSVNEVAVIHVYDDSIVMPDRGDDRLPDMEDFTRFIEAYKKEGKKILSEAVDYFAREGIHAKPILKGGHPAHQISRVGEGYDVIVMGSRGLGGLKRLFLGSVSNAVLQEAKTNILVVK